MNDLKEGKRILNKMTFCWQRYNYKTNYYNYDRINFPLKRDSISFYFEQSEDNSDNNRKFTIFRIYYNYDEYKKIIKNEFLDIDKEKINIKASPFEVSKIQLNDLIEYLIYSNDEISMILRKEVSINQNFSNLSDDEVVEYLNLIFYKVYYDCKKARFIPDDTFENVDALYTKCIENNNIDNDYRPNSYMNDFDGSNTYALRVYNVGQGNCSAIIKYTDKAKSDYDVIMVFDFGLENGKNNSDLNEMISKINHQIIILISHFDIDHINNVVNRLDLMTPWWIFPEYHGEGIKANKFFAVLLKVASKKTFSGIVPKYDGFLNLSTNIKIYQTKGKMDPNQSTKANAECLVSIILTNRNNVLIPADSLYQEYDPRIFENHYDYVLIPHHCCKYDTSLINGDKKIDNIIGSNTKGIVLSGKNDYGHANNNHLLRYPKQILFSSTKIYDDNKIDITSKSKIFGLLGNFYEIKL